MIDSHMTEPWLTFCCLNYSAFETRALVPSERNLFKAAASRFALPFADEIRVACSFLAKLNVVDWLNDS